MEANKKDSYSWCDDKYLSKPMIIIYIISFLILVYIVSFYVKSTKDFDRLQEEGVCTAMTVTQISTKRGRNDSPFARVIYLAGDTIVHSSVSNINGLEPNTQYWALYLPDNPHIVASLRDRNGKAIPIADSLKVYEICNCFSTRKEQLMRDFSLRD